METIKTGIRNGLFTAEETLNKEDSEKAEAILKLLDKMEIASARRLLEAVKEKLLESIYTV